MAQLVTIKVAQLVTIKNGHFFNFWLLNMCWNTFFIVFFSNINQNLPQKMATKKTITFHILQNTGWLKKPFCCNPPFHQKLLFFNLGLLKPKTLMLNNKHSLKSGNSKDKEKGFETKNKTGNKKEKILMKKHFAI